MFRKYLTDLSLILVAVIWALNFSIIKVTLTEIDPYSFNALRFIFAAVILYSIARKRGYTLKVQKEDFWKLVGIGIVGNLFYQVLFMIGIDYTYSANAAVMLGTIPIWVAILSQFFTDEKMTTLTFIGVVLAFSGVALIIAGGENEISFQSKTFLGDVITVIAALCWAVFTIMSRKYLKTYSPVQYSAFMSVIGVICLSLVGAPSLLKLDWSGISWLGFGGIIYSGALSVGVAYIIWNRGVKVIGAVRTAAYQNLVPVLGLLFGVILLGEELALLQYIGAALVICGIVIARLEKKSPTSLNSSKS
ncbi:DMT family transporter [Balneola sp. MJW-20]|uniref:DMT family transporter n=1 Tax=Gracilimonas aurantiaca TaxID=3234185 RepID=UPI0034664C02